MIHQNAILAMLVILSTAALAGVFTVQVADAQLPRLSVDASGVGVLTEELDLRADARGVVIFQTEEFGVTADRSGVEMGGPQEFSLGVRDSRVGVQTEEFRLLANPSGVEIRPPPS